MAKATAFDPVSLKIVPLPAVLETEQPGRVSKIAGEGDTYPCRRCLMDAEAGDEVYLLSYDPFLGDSPYRCASPIFVHKKQCTPYQGAEVPEQQRKRLLSVRAYDAGHMIVGHGDVLEGTKLEQTSEELLSDPAVEYIHVHNARPGCFAVRIERA